MKEKHHTLCESDREKIVAQIKGKLEDRPDILFAYLHGSFVSSDRFRDIDLAIFLAQSPSSPLDYELSMEAELGGAIIGPCCFDVRILNGAPLSFRYNVIKNGKLLLSSDDDARCEFEEAALSNYFDFEPFRKRYLMEVMGLGT